MQNVLSLSAVRKPAGLRKKGFRVAKRAFDIVFSLLLMVALSPVALIVAVVAAVDTKGSPLFVQKRMGRYNQPFSMLKFRTMSVSAPANVATYELRHADRYISKVGGVLRKLSLDELPQLWNIFVGDMSFVGPRPVVLTETDLLARRTANGAASVRPGLTGLAQVNGRDDVAVREKARLDGLYARKQGLALDWHILCRTVDCVLHARGVTEGANPAIAAPQRKRRSA